METVQDILREIVDRTEPEDHWKFVLKKVFIKRNSDILSKSDFIQINQYLYCSYIYQYFGNTDNIKYLVDIDCFYLKFDFLKIKLPTSHFKKHIHTLVNEFSKDMGNSDNVFQYFYMQDDYICNVVNEFIFHLTGGSNLNAFLNYGKSNQSYTLKREVKSKINRKFVIGRQYSLRILKKNSNFDAVYKTFILKKFAYKIRDKELPVLIMKQIDGPQNNMFSLSKADCRLYHLKYEDGLQMFNMQLPFKEVCL